MEVNLWERLFIQHVDQYIQHSFIALLIEVGKQHVDIEELRPE